MIEFIDGLVVGGLLSQGSANTTHTFDHGDDWHEVTSEPETKITKRQAKKLAEDYLARPARHVDQEEAFDLMCTSEFLPVGRALHSDAVKLLPSGNIGLHLGERIVEGGS